MSIDNLTFGELKQIAAMFSGNSTAMHNATDHFMIGSHVIIRTYSAGVWAGILDQKSGNEVILANARRMWQWHAAESISLSGCAVYGIDQSKSRIAPAVEKTWLEAIEILPLTAIAKDSIMGAKNAKA